MTGTPQVTSTCDASDTSTISYTVTGVSGAPYPGTFTESGVATIGPQPFPNVQAVPALTFSASFVIDSPAGQVTGTKQLTQDIFIATGLGVCTEALKSFGIAATYSARIRTATEHSPIRAKRASRSTTTGPSARRPTSSSSSSRI